MILFVEDIKKLRWPSVKKFEIDDEDDIEELGDDEQENIQ